MINFRVIYEYLWTSFRVERDTQLVDNLQQKGEWYAMMIKHTWFFGLFTMLKVLLPIVILSGANIFFVYSRFHGEVMGIVLWIVFAILACYLVFVSLNYLRNFHKNHHQSFEIRNLEDIHNELVEGDKLFTAFFNQLQTLYFFLIITVSFDIIYIIYQVFRTGNAFLASSTYYMLLEIVCLVIQIYFNRLYNIQMINLDMDYILATKDQVYFLEQKAMYTDSRSLERDKIKTIRSTYPNFIASFFGFGDIAILLEGGDDLTHGIVQMQTIQAPEETVAHMYELFTGKWNRVLQIKNLYLRKIAEEQKLMPDDPDFYSKVQQYIRDSEVIIQKDYIECEDTKIKSDIYDLYKEYHIGEKG